MGTGADTFFTHKLKRTGVIGAALLAVALLFYALQASVYAEGPGTPHVVAAVGDIACGDGTKTEEHPDEYLCRDDLARDAVASFSPELFLALGDLQYEAGSSTDFANHYDHTFGQFKLITKPAVGNHEYGTRDAKGYFDYFNGVDNSTNTAGDRDKGYYSYNIGDNWHVVALNSNCISRDSSIKGGREGSFAVSCSPDSPQVQWLRQDLAANMNKQCTLAYWHHPRYTEGSRADYAETAPLWQALYDYGADLVLAGHTHYYQRFAPTNNSNAADPAYGITQIVVGTGGKEVSQTLAALNGPTTAHPTLQKRFVGIGALKLTLNDNSFGWDYVNGAGYTNSDSGTTNCHGAPGTPDPNPVLIPSTTLGAVADSYVNSGSPNSNYGGNEFMYTQGTGSDGGNSTRFSYLKFDLSSVVASDVKKVLLRLFAGSRSSDAVQTIYEVTDNSWKEKDTDANTPDGIRYANRPALDGQIIGTIQANGNNDWQEIDVTDVIKAHAGQAAFSMGISSPSTSTSALKLATRDSTTDQPQLFIQKNTLTPTTGTIAVQSTDDAYVSQANPAVNYGASPQLVNNNSLGNVSRSWLKFTVPAIPAGTEITSATVTLNATNSSAAVANIKQSTDTSWTQSTLTWSNAPAYNSTAISNGDRSVTPGPITFNVTPAITGAGTYSFVITQSNPVETTWSSLEASSGQPTLTVNYAPIVTPPVTPTTTLNPAADAYVDATNPAVNYGSAASLQADASPETAQYYKFDLGSLAGKRVTSAKLRLYVTNGSAGPQDVRSVADTAWDESTLNYTNRPAVGSAVGQLASNNKANQYAVVDVTAAVNAKAGSLLSLAVDSTSTDGLYVDSKEGTNKPELVIEYADPLTTTFQPTGDAYVDSSHASTNYGSAVSLSSDTDNSRVTFLKFDLSSLSANYLMAAKLRIYVNNASVNTQNIKLAANSTWDESTINFTNQPGLLTQLGTVTTNNQASKWYEINLGDLSTYAGSVVSLAIENQGGDGLYIDSRETTNSPELVVQYR